MENSKWISVEERMPPYVYDDVLVLFERGGHFRRRVVVGYWRGGESWGPAIARKFKVTHWSPLPEVGDL